jgi:hypothetical protein
MEADSFGHEAILHKLCNFDILPREKLRAPLNDCHFDSEPAESLPKLTANRAAAEHDHAFGFFP